MRTFYAVYRDVVDLECFGAESRGLSKSMRLYDEVSLAAPALVIRCGPCQPAASPLVARHVVPVEPAASMLVARFYGPSTAGRHAARREV